MKKYILPILMGFGFILLGWLTSSLFDVAIYELWNKPLLSPPRIVFPIAWGILYFLLGAYFSNILIRKELSLIGIFSIMMVINYTWSLVFFNLGLLSIALLMVVIMFILTLYIIARDKNKFKYILIPYLLWLIFAGYLNFSIILLNY